MFKSLKSRYDRLNLLDDVILRMRYPFSGERYERWLPYPVWWVLQFVHFIPFRIFDSLSRWIEQEMDAEAEAIS